MVHSVDVLRADLIRDFFFTFCTFGTQCTSKYKTTTRVASFLGASFEPGDVLVLVLSKVHGTLHTTSWCYITENLILDNECNQLCCPGTLSLQDPSYHLYSPMPSLPKLCACSLWRDLQRCKYSVSHNICFKCFATYNSLFKDPDDFRGRFNTMRVLNSSPAVQRLVAVIQHPQPDGGDVLEADDKEVKNLLESAIATSEQQPSSQGIKQLN